MLAEAQAERHSAPSHPAASHFKSHPLLSFLSLHHLLMTHFSIFHQLGQESGNLPLSLLLVFSPIHSSSHIKQFSYVKVSLSKSLDLAAAGHSQSRSVQ